jgi:multidrug resistance efflux pump
VTFVAPRVSGEVTRVLVDDDNRVKKGGVLMSLWKADDDYELQTLPKPPCPPCPPCDASSFCCAILLVELDPEPYRVEVAIKQAAVDTCC